MALGSGGGWNNLDALSGGCSPVEGRRSSTPTTSFLSSNGSMTVEAAVIIPVLIFLMGAILSLGMRLSNYMYLNQIGRELVLQMGTVKCLAQFSSGALPTSYTYILGPQNFYPTEPSQSAISSCLNDVESSCPSVNTGCPLNVLHHYAATLVKSKPLRVDGNISMEYSFVPPASNPASGVCLLTIRFSAQDPTWMNFIGGPISTITQGPYLASPMPSAGNNCLL